MTADEVPAADETGKIRGAETARRTVRVLTALAARQPIGLDELAKVVGLNKNTTYRLLRVLQEEGYSERLPQGGYRLGPAAAALSPDSSLSASGLQAARPAMQELAEITGETVTLHRRGGGMAGGGGRGGRWSPPGGGSRRPPGAHWSGTSARWPSGAT